MKWENLREFKCPYCGSDLSRKDDIRCTKCLFKITEERFKSIAENRLAGKIKGKGMKWQNLKIERCPACGDYLGNQNGKLEILRCSNYECEFKIRVDRMNEILNDSEHVANRYSVASNIAKLNNL